jgi:iron-sulfur cluster assembly protein
MVKITPAAAQQIRKAAEQSNAQDLCLRLAVTLGQDGSFEYGMGFDEKKDSDTVIQSEGVEVAISDRSKELFMGAVLDYVEINPGEHRFIFTNPNDPAHNPSPVQRRT